MVWSDNIVQAKIEISIFSLGKGRILAASACPSQTEGRAREGKDPFLPTSTLTNTDDMSNMVCVVRKSLICGTFLQHLHAV